MSLISSQVNAIKNKLSLAIILVLGLTGLANGQVVDTQKFLAEATFYENGSTPELENLSIVSTDTATSYYQTSEGYKIALLNEKEVLWEENISIGFRGPYFVPKSKSIALYMPYYEKADRIQIKKGRKVVLNYSIVNNLCSLNGKCTDYCSRNNAKVLSCTCGDGVCQDFESQELCSEDCGEEVEEGGTAVEGGEGSESFMDGEGVAMKFVYVLIGLLVLGLVWIVFRSDL